MSENDGDLQRTIGKFRRDPLGFVRYAFPWGVAGTALARDAGFKRLNIDLIYAIPGQTLTFVRWAGTFAALTMPRKPGLSPGTPAGLRVRSTRPATAAAVRRCPKNNQQDIDEPLKRDLLDRRDGSRFWRNASHEDLS